MKGCSGLTERILTLARFRRSENGLCRDGHLRGPRVQRFLGLGQRRQGTLGLSVGLTFGHRRNRNHPLPKMIGNAGRILLARPALIGLAIPDKDIRLETFADHLRLGRGTRNLHPNAREGFLKMITQQPRNVAVVFNYQDQSFTVWQRSHTRASAEALSRKRWRGNYKFSHFVLATTR